MKKFTVNEPAALKNFTDNTCPQASFAFRALLRRREIRVNGVRVSSDVPLRAGDEVCYYMTPAQEQKSSHLLIYEDGAVLVADKESGVNSEALFAELGGRARERGEQIFPIHRLDRNTAGLMILAKTPSAERELRAAFRDRRVEKRYLAVVLGVPASRHAVEEAYLEKDKDAAAVKVRKAHFGNAEKIVTEYEVLETHGEESLLGITLHTGKTHQIRAHMAFLGHPVVGDEKYGDAAYNRAVHAVRQRLVAKSLAFGLTGELCYLNGKVFVSARTPVFS